MRIATLLLAVAACVPVDLVAATDDPTTVSPDNVPFVCCSPDMVDCAQGRCLPHGYCPVACDPDDPTACGDPLWATCKFVDDRPDPVCVKVTASACDPIHPEN